MTRWASLRSWFKGKKCVCVYNIFTCIGYIFIVDFGFFFFLLFIECMIANSNYS